MPKRAKELSALAVSRLRGDGRYAVGGAPGLHLRIAGNSRSWVLRVQIGAGRHDIGLGAYPEIGLADAREAATNHRRRIRDGGDPLDDKRSRKAASKAAALKAPTFKDCAIAFIKSQRAGWASEKHADQWSATLEAYAYPHIGDRRVDAIATAHVLDALRPIWTTKPETATRIRGRIEAVLDAARVNGHREGENPARWRGHLDKLLPPRSKVKPIAHHAALPYADLPRFLSELRIREGIAVRALEFGILCASRSGEVRLATRREFDLVQKTWIIPAERMKARREHRVPLTDAAVAILEALPPREPEDVMFPAPKGGALSDMTLTAVLRRMGREEITVHGFRSTFRDWAGEATSHPREVIEHALAHQLKDKAEAAYQRGDLLARRRELMADWAAFCRGPVTGE